MIVLLQIFMPRQASLSPEDIIAASMSHFWAHGYYATSIDDLVEALGTNRQAIYAGIGGKQALYHRCLSSYQAAIVTPAFARVEKAGAELADVQAFFETQICLAEQVGLPGPGCFVANASTETAQHDQIAADLVAAHHDRLRAGFKGVVKNEAPHFSEKDCADLADFLLVSTQGLWSMSRTVTSADFLRRHATTLLSLLTLRLKS